MKDKDYLIVVPCCGSTLYVDPTARRGGHLISQRLVKSNKNNLS